MCVCFANSLKTDVFALLVLSFLCARISLKKGDRLELILNARRCAKANGGDYLERLYSFFTCVCVPFESKFLLDYLKPRYNDDGFKGKILYVIDE